MNRKRTQKEEKVKTVIRQLIIILTLIIIGVFSYNAYKLLIKPANTARIKEGSVAQEESTVGYIIREETVIQSENYTNGITQIKSEGEKVSKGIAVYRYANENEKDINQKIEELDEQINEAMANQESVFSADIKLLEAQIEEKLNLLRTENNLEKIKEYKNDVSNIITKKAKIAGELSPSGSYIKELIDERANYLAQISASSEEIYAPSAGIISYKVDELENVFVPGDFSYINTNFLEELNLKTGQVIATSNEKGKIIKAYQKVKPSDNPKDVLGDL